MRSPSGTTQSGRRGRDPVARRMASASISSVPSSVSTATVYAPDEPAGARDHADALRLQQAAHRFVQPLLDRRDPLAQGVEVEVALGAQSHDPGARQLRQLATRRDHRFRRDAVPEVRGAADDVAFDERHLGAERRRDRGRGVAGRSTAEDHEAHRHRPRLPSAFSQERDRHLRRPERRAEHREIGRSSVPSRSECDHGDPSGERNTEKSGEVPCRAVASATMETVPEIRNDALTDRLVIVAAERADAPGDVPAGAVDAAAGSGCVPVLPGARARDAARGRPAGWR